MLGFCFQEAWNWCPKLKPESWIVFHVSQVCENSSTPTQPQCSPVLFVFLSKRLFKKPPFPAAGDRAVFTGFVSRGFCFLIYHSSDLVKTKGDIGSQGTDKKKEVNIVESFFLLFNAWPHTYTGFLLHSARWDSHYGNGDVDGVHFRSLQGSHLPQGKAS